MLTAILLLTIGASPAAAVEPTPQWIWGTAEREASQTFCLRGQAPARAKLVRARLTAVADYCRAVLFIHDAEVARSEPYGPPMQVDVTEHLRAGENPLSLCCRSVDGPAAAMLRLELEYEDGSRETYASDAAWQACRLDSSRLAPPATEPSTWQPVAALGAVEKHPWGDASDTISIQPSDNYEQWKQAIGAPAGADPQSFQTLPGFEVQLLRSAAADEDSWVSLASDDRGRWIIAKEKRGLLRLTLPQEKNGAVRVETIDDSLAECRGLLFAHGSLYAMANNDRALVRLRDTDGDDRFDEASKLATFEGGVGHGRNQLALGPDGLIYCIFGDSVSEPPTAHSQPPRLTHPTRHEQGQSGFVARTDRDGRRWQVMVRGLRNPYGIDFNPHGEMFTYDADAEYDMGSSWYRPTRINHLLPGGDFGWRAVTGQWPPYFPDRPDMPQPTLDIGKGSPTAVRFGAASRFPPPYRQTLFALDWAYGRILAVHLAPRGASYAAHAETFLRGRPLNVTDLQFGPDGAMYFVTGGRSTRSALYRVAYTGPEVADAAAGPQQAAREQHASEARRVRRQLEAYLGRQDARALAVAWPHLNASDPWIRLAARGAVESQPVASWRQRVLKETSLDAALAVLMALARVGADADATAIIQRVNQIELSSLSDRQRLEVVFLYDRCLPEDAASSAVGQEVLRRLEGLYPADSFQVNRPLSLLLARLGSPDLVPRTVPLLEAAADQTERLHYLYVLRNAQNGWTPALRAAYFGQLARMSEFVGGEGMPTFRRLIENEALAAAPADERAGYSKLLLGSLLGPAPSDVSQEERPFVRKWTLADFPEPLSELSELRDLKRGEQMFAAARCIACHRVAGRGGVLGPDLTALARRFTPHDMLVSILEPSRVVAENYRNDAFQLRDGRVVVGRIVPGDYRSPQLSVVPDLLAPEKTITFGKSEIETHQPSPASPMPEGLLDTLTREEILDLLAYLHSIGGN